VPQIPAASLRPTPSPSSRDPVPTSSAAAGTGAACSANPQEANWAACLQELWQAGMAYAAHRRCDRCPQSRPSFNVRGPSSICRPILGLLLLLYPWSPEGAALQRYFSLSTWPSLSTSLCAPDAGQNIRHRGLRTSTGASDGNALCAAAPPAAARCGGKMSTFRLGIGMDWEFWILRAEQVLSLDCNL